jgi:hypothetical protein
MPVELVALALRAKRKAAAMAVGQHRQATIQAADRLEPSSLAAQQAAPLMATAT